MQTYQQAQLLSTSQFIVQLPQIRELHQLQSPFAAQAQKLVDDNATFTRRSIRCFYSAGDERGGASHQP